jgi:hypothetical protein
MPTGNFAPGAHLTTKALYVVTGFLPKIRAALAAYLLYREAIWAPGTAR